jgi:serine/threonine-protein kinase
MIPANREPSLRVPSRAPPGKAPDDALLPDLRRALAPRYDVIQRVGEGGMAVVYRARDPRHDRDVAIKIIRPEMAASIAADRFLREIRVTAKLQHPNIVALFDSGTADDYVYYVMPLIEGETLRSKLQHDRQLPIELALQLARDVAGALDYAHSHGVVHRDIKPENIIVSSGHAVIADFGIASALERMADSERATTEGTLIGTTTYMSPEQCVGGKHLDGRTDIYASGCVLYEMLTGEPPFSGRTAQAIMARHVSERVPDVRVLRPDVPPRLRRILTTALAKAPADRYQTAGAMEGALQDVDRARPGMAVRLATVAVGAAVAALALNAALKPRGRALDVNRVAIFPLAERGFKTGNAGAGGAAIAVMINSALEHADPLRPLDVQDHLTIAQRSNPDAITMDERRRIAREAGAAWYLAGVVQSLGDVITVSLRLYDVKGDSLLDQNSATGDRADSTLYRLGLDGVRGLLPSLVDPGRPVDLAPLRDRRPGAVALFVQGERAYRRSTFPEALGFYRRALAEDSSLVLAAVKGALSAYWADHGAAKELALYAASRDSLLPPRYAAFARGLAAFDAGHADSAEAWLTRAVRAAPGWPEALYQLAEVYMHLIPNRAPLDSLAEAGLREALAADSGFSPPLIHLSEIVIRQGRLDEATRLMSRLNATRPTADHIAHLGLMHGCLTQGASDFAWESDSEARPEIVLKAARMLAVAGTQLPCAESAFRVLMAVGPDSLKYGAAFGLQNVLAAQGRVDALVRLVDSVVSAGTLPVLMTAYIVDAAAGLPVQQQVAVVERKAHGYWGADYSGLSALRPLEWLQWLFGVSHAVRGDREMVASLRHTLEGEARGHGDPVTRLYAEALRAHEVLLGGDTAIAIARFRGLTPVVPSDSLTWSIAMPLAVERLRLAQLLLARGEHSAAIRVASVFDHPEPAVYVAFLPASLDIRLRAAQALGWREPAERFRLRRERLRMQPSPPRSQ